MLGPDEEVVEPVGVDVLTTQFHRVVVGEAERPRDDVAQARELAHVGRDGGADLLARTPRLLAKGDVAALLQDLREVVVGERLPADDAPRGREALLDARLQLDDREPRLDRALERQQLAAQLLERATEQGIGDALLERAPDPREAVGVPARPARSPRPRP